MSDLSGVQDLERTVTLHRRRGDALTRRGRLVEAKEAYEAALSLVDEALNALPISHPVERAHAPSLDPDVAAETADLLGVRGGILRRLGRVDEALESYRYGAVFEASHALPQTYNRANAIKLALITGNNTVGQLNDELVAFHDALELRLSTDERAADDAWIWADLGDVRLLLGDDDGAKVAYQAFVDKAGTPSAASTLAVLKEIVHALDEHGDRDAPRMAVALSKVEAMLQG